MKAVIATDSISLLPLRGRHHPFTRPRAATLSVAITAYTIIFGVILRIIVKIFKRFFKLWKNIFIFAGNIRSCLKFFQKFFAASFRHVSAVFIVK